MKSKRTPQFIKELKKLPRKVRKEAKEAYELWKVDPFHPSLNFEHIGSNVWTARVGIHYRVIGLRKPPDTMTWHRIVSHEDYNTITNKARPQAKIIMKKINK